MVTPSSNIEQPLSRARRPRPWHALLLASLVASLSPSCDPTSGEVEQSESALSGGATVLGFESVKDWTIVDNGRGTLRSSDVRTQGMASLGVDAKGYVPIRSRTLSTLPAPAGSLACYDLFIPKEQAPQSSAGAAHLFIDVPSRAVHKVAL